MDSDQIRHTRAMANKIQIHAQYLVEVCKYMANCAYADLRDLPVEKMIARLTHDSGYGIQDRLESIQKVIEDMIGELTTTTVDSAIAVTTDGLEVTCGLSTDDPLPPFSLYRHTLIFQDYASLINCVNTSGYYSELILIDSVSRPHVPEYKAIFVSYTPYDKLGIGLYPGVRETHMNENIPDTELSDDALMFALKVKPYSTPDEN